MIRERRAWERGLIALVVRRFSAFAGCCVVGVIVTGSYSAWAQLGELPAVWSTAYGRTLAVKCMLVIGAIGLGALSRYTVLPALGAREVPAPPGHVGGTSRGWGRASLRPPAPLARLAVYISGEALLALLVLGCTAWLTPSTPPRHLEHHEHRRGVATDSPALSLTGAEGRGRMARSRRAPATDGSASAAPGFVGGDRVR